MRFCRRLSRFQSGLYFNPPAGHFVVTVLYFVLHVLCVFSSAMCFCCSVVQCVFVSAPDLSHVTSCQFPPISCVLTCFPLCFSLCVIGLCIYSLWFLDSLLAFLPYVLVLPFVCVSVFCSLPLFWILFRSLLCFAYMFLFPCSFHK